MPRKKLTDAERREKNRVKVAAWRAKNPGKTAESCRRWREKHPGAQAAADKKWYEKNGDKARAHARERYQEDPEKHCAKTREWCKNNPEKNRAKSKNWAGKSMENKAKKAYWTRNAMYKHKYGITVEDYDQMIEDQNGMCAVCGELLGEAKKPHPVDHDHSKKGRESVRGVVHLDCNTIVGIVETRNWKIDAADLYLSKFEDREDGGPEQDIDVRGWLYSYCDAVISHLWIELWYAGDDSDQWRDGHFDFGGCNDCARGRD